MKHLVIEDDGKDHASYASLMSLGTVFMNIEVFPSYIELNHYTLSLIFVPLLMNLKMPPFSERFSISP